MTTADQIATDARVQEAWAALEAAHRRYARMCAVAAADPRPRGLFTANIAQAELSAAPGTFAQSAGLERLVLTLYVPRGAAVPPYLASECAATIHPRENR